MVVDYPENMRVLGSIYCRTMINSMKSPSFYYKRLDTNLMRYEIEWQHTYCVEEYKRMVNIANDVWETIKSTHFNRNVEYEPMIAGFFFDADIPLPRILVDDIMSLFVSCDEEQNSNNIVERIWSLSEARI